MIDRTKLKRNYSAEVRLKLIVGDRVFPLWQIAPHFVIPHSGLELPPTDAEVVMTVDGDEQRWHVRLANGAVPFDTKIPIHSLPSD